jgi:hypothetical protein
MDTYGWMHSTLGEPTLDLQNAPKPLAAGASPRTPLGELTALPQTPLAGFQGRRFAARGRKREGKGREGKGREGNLAPPPIGTAGSATEPS